MSPSKIGANTRSNPELLAVGFVALLVLGLFAALLGNAPLAGGNHPAGASGCTTNTWRNPITGRTEALGAGHVGKAGAVPCR